MSNIETTEFIRNLQNVKFFQRLKIPIDVDLNQQQQQQQKLKCEN